MRRMIPEQLDLSRELPIVIGSVDYQEFTRRLIEVDRLLRETGIENDFIEKALSRREAEGRAGAEKEGRRYREPGGKKLARLQKMFRLALRCTIARLLTEKEYRPFSMRLPDSTLLQWFCGIERFEVIQVPGKSSLERYDKMVPEEDVRALVNRLNMALRYNLWAERTRFTTERLSEWTKCNRLSVGTKCCDYVWPSVASDS